MCGIAGLWYRSGAPAPELERLGSHMAGTIQHRGPDDSGVWVDGAAGIALAHRRLSIIDLSPTGHQPMRSPGGRFVIVYNGEIYNFGPLRQELEAAGVRFRGTSDTEVLLAGAEVWGIRPLLDRVRGMFAFALWDTQSRELFLARDRMGEKPLYVARMPWGIAFASEFRAFETLPGWSLDLDHDALASCLRLGYIAGSRTIDRKVTRLVPASVVRIAADHVPAELAIDPASGSPDAERYWSIETEAAATAVPAGADEAVSHLEELLRDTLRGQRIADVPLGSFLSGGIDSTIVTALLQQISDTPVRTFSVGFEEPEYDESSYARAIAKHLRCDHTEFRISSAEALEVVGQLADVFDEPFADSSQIPTILVARLARRGGVTVCLSGDGGDELFGGYNRYFWGESWGKTLQSLPRSVRHLVAGSAATAVRACPDGVLRRVVMAGGSTAQNPRARLLKAVRMLKLDDPAERYRDLILYNADPSALLAVDVAADTIRQELQAHMERWGDVFGAMVWDIHNYLPGDHLTKVDRASMTVSLEMRTPLLDHRVAAFGLAASKSFGVQRLAASPKWLLRQVLYRHVPRELVERPKMGLSAPLGRWLRGELRDWAESLLSANQLEQQGLFRVPAVRALWKEHVDGTADRSVPLWPVLIFQQWLAASRSRALAAAAEPVS